MPPLGQDVLVVWGNSQYVALYSTAKLWRIRDGGWIRDGAQCVVPVPSHWMPLPDLPDTTPDVGSVNVGGDNLRDTVEKLQIEYESLCCQVRSLERKYLNHQHSMNDCARPINWTGKAHLFKED